jgi:7,8-dihydroneopterin aldolase/epimerase/oxygenase
MKTKAKINKNSLCELFISDLRVWVHLGCSEEEKHNPQLISFNISIIFKSAPLGLTTDRLEDTICYRIIVQQIQKFCENKKFNLIEHLAFAIHKTIEESLGDKKQNINLIEVTVHKVSPPVPDMHGGVCFTYSNPPKIQKDHK